MKVLILGGTRFFGRELALRLVRQGDQVTVLTRGHLSAPEGVTQLVGDRNEPAALAQAADAGFDAVVDNIAYTASHVRAAVEAFAGKTGHYVFTSSTAVYMLAGRPPYFEEAAPPAAGSYTIDDPKAWAYTVGKIEAERELLGQDRLSFTIVRPPVVIGPNDPTLRLHYYVQRILDGGPLLLVDGGKHSFHLADSEDLAEGMALVLQAGPRVFGQAYNVCQKDLLSLDELVHRAAEALSRTLDLVPVPRSVAGEAYAEALGPYPQPMICPPERIVRELGLRPRPVLDSVTRAAIWHAENPGKDSAGYERRAAEIDLARRFRKSVEALQAG